MIRKLIERLGAFQPILSIKLYLELLLLVNHLDHETKFYDEWSYVHIFCNISKLQVNVYYFMKVK